MIDAAVAKKSLDRLAVLGYHAILDPLLGSVHSAIAEMCLRNRAQTVLDIASATGAQCRELGALGLRATGLDLSETMIRFARQRRSEAVTYVLGSAFCLPFQNDSFDAALLVLALHQHSEEHRQVMLSEARRVTRSAGQLITADYLRPSNPTTNPAWWLVRGIEKLAGGDHYLGFVDFVECGGVIGFLERAGLHAVEEHRLCGGTIGIVRVPLAP
ncbi:class I SAM-dependent methyltransferase [Candidatus Bipolaricaulota bacterium]|nr:class I SAM-dependent methyltransferase [Candidatus Bipolaricaulota bacterium]